MEKYWMRHLPIYGIEKDCILSRQGDFTIAFRVKKPELFTLAEQEYEALHQALVKAIGVLPVNTVIHLQDWYLKRAFDADEGGGDSGRGDGSCGDGDRGNGDHDDGTGGNGGRGDGASKSWLSAASDQFFKGREFSDHHAYLFITKRAVRRASTSLLSGLLRPHLVPSEPMSKRAMEGFFGYCGQFQQIVNDSKLFRLERMTNKELWSSKEKMGSIERYCSLETGELRVLKDVYFTDGVGIGEKQCALFTLADGGDLPTACCPRTDHEPYSTDSSKVSVGFAAGLGLLLDYDHIVNQYIFITDGRETLKKMEAKSLRMQSLSAYSRENAVNQQALGEFLQEAASYQRMPVKAHVNVMLWTDDKAKMADITNAATAAFVRMGCSARQEKMGAPQIWWAGIPGNAGDFPMNDTFDTFVEQAVCFFQLETNYRSSESAYGLRLGDRLSGLPVNVDFDREARANGLIGNFNTVVISGSGGGKSYFLNHAVRSYIEQGAHVVIIDVGHSYELQCMLHGGTYLTFEEEKPISFNPFWLGKGEVLDTEKKESLKSLLVALWKRADETYTRSEYVTLSAALQQYFEKLDCDGSLAPGFNSFYEFLQDEFIPRLMAEQVKEKDFDGANFLYVLRPYYRGGEFDYLLNGAKNLELLQQRLVVFELDAVKSHPILYPILTILIMDLGLSKMRKLKSTFKVMIIEEAWQAIAEQGMGDYMKYLEKTARKFFLKMVLSTQELDDLLASDILKKTVINNSDTVILLDQSKMVNDFDQLQQLLAINEKQKAEVLSINRGRETGRWYKDVWIRSGASHSRVYRLETSPEEYCVYTSEQKEKQVIKEYIGRYGGLREGITALIRAGRVGGGRLLLVLLMVIGPLLLQAQDPASIIGTGISKVIKAFDLQVQRLQTQTIVLQEAQKVIENAMSQLRLDEIREWVQAQKDLYSDYFQELWQVKTVISDYHRVAEVVQRQEQLLAAYDHAWGLLRNDPHFSPGELSHMSAVYGGILKESEKNLDLLLSVVQSFSVQMSDAERMAMVDRAAAGMDKNLNDLTRFNNQNTLLSLQRSKEAGDIDLLKKLYGL